MKGYCVIVGQTFVLSFLKGLHNETGCSGFFKSASSDDHSLILVCFIYFGPRHVLLGFCRPPEHSLPCAASTKEGTRLNLRAALPDKRSSLRQGQNKDFTDRNTSPCSFDATSILLIKLQNICPPSYARPDLLHKGNNAARWVRSCTTYT